MNVLAFDASYGVPTARPRQRRRWWHFWRRPPAPQPAPRRTGLSDDIPEWLRREKARAANVTPVAGRAYERPKLSDYEPKPEPPPEPVSEPPAALDPIADLKFQLRKVLTYGQFMDVMSGIAGREQQPHDALPETAWKWATT
jgi:hypothetical protein